MQVWYKATKGAEWKSPNEVQVPYGKASTAGYDQVVFNIKGNDFRLIAAINDATGIVHIRFMGTHKEYDLIAAVAP